MLTNSINRTRMNLDKKDKLSINSNALINNIKKKADTISPISPLAYITFTFDVLNEKYSESTSLFKNTNNPPESIMINEDNPTLVLSTLLCNTISVVSLTELFLFTFANKKKIKYSATNSIIINHEYLKIVPSFITIPINKYLNAPVALIINVGHAKKTSLVKIVQAILQRI